MIQKTKTELEPPLTVYSRNVLGVKTSVSKDYKKRANIRRDNYGKCLPRVSSEMPPELKLQKVSLSVNRHQASNLKIEINNSVDLNKFKLLRSK